MRLFVNDWVESLLRRVGMNDSDPIQSEMVQTRLRHAQKRIANASAGDTDTLSATEWFALNAPTLRQ